MVGLKGINSFGLLNHDKNPLPCTISFHLSIGKLIFAIEAVGKGKFSPVISFNKNVKNSLLLTVPHSRMHLRKFVLLPLQELDSNWLHPLLKKNIKFFLKKVKHQRIKKLKID